MRRTAALLRRVADRIDHEGAPKLTRWSFTFERGRGLVFREDKRGCPVAYLGDKDYGRAHAESDTAVADRERQERLKALVDQMTMSAQEFGKRLNESFARLAKALPPREG